MRFQRVCLESFGYVLPGEVVTSAQLERQLVPVYQRLRLPEGRLELITGVRQRRLWPRHTRPSDQSIRSGQLALEAAQQDPQDVGALVHGSVCRDHLEPATACRVHHQLKLPDHCLVYDVSNACLGMLNGMLQVACMIELGQIHAGLVVGTEDSRYLLETTIQTLNADPSLSRDEIKRSIASLTIGSASCACLLVNAQMSRTDNRLISATALANTRFHRLCYSGQDQAVVDGMQPVMWTDSEQLMERGIATGVAAFERFLDEAQWGRDQLARTFCHQVGLTHRRRMLEALGLALENDFFTVDWLGNTGSVALPVTMAIACQNQYVGPGSRIALLGIGSGINCLMLAVQWQKSLVCGVDDA